MRVCGIFGVVRTSGISTRDQAGFAKLAEALRHRGPDSVGHYENDRVLLGATRLSINDVGLGYQPFKDASGQIIVFGNGEIYNSPELRRLDRIRDQKFRSSSDIEVVAHLFAQSEVETFSKLRGMFALAVLDISKNLLHLARDPIGEKPLLLAKSPGGIVFASELSALVASRLVDFTLRRDVWAEYLLTGYISEPRTPISGLYKLPPGSFLTVNIETGGTTEQAYWTPRVSTPVENLDPDYLEQLITSSVQDALHSDVPIGLALSGGLDSSLVAALAAKGNPNIKAFSVGYPNAQSVDETSDAEYVASHLGLDFERVEVTPEDAIAGFPMLCTDRDEPIGDISGTSYSAVASACRAAGAPVLLTGQGGDELFWGYPWVRNAAQALANRVAGNSTYLGTPERHIGWPNFSSPPALLAWLEDLGGLRSLLRERQLAAQIKSRQFRQFRLYDFDPQMPRLRNDTQSVLAADLHGIREDPYVWDTGVSASFAITEAIFNSYLLTNGLAQMDRLSMAHSVESRTPLVATPIVEYLQGYRLTHDDSTMPPKGLLREVAARHLPPHVINRPKRGFTPPARSWISGISQTYSNVLREPVLGDSGLFGPDIAPYLATPFTRLGRSKTIWLRLVVLEFWMRGLMSAVGAAPRFQDAISED